MLKLCISNLKLSKALQWIKLAHHDRKKQVPSRLAFRMCISHCFGTTITSRTGRWSFCSSMESMSNLLGVLILQAVHSSNSHFCGRTVNQPGKCDTHSTACSLSHHTDTCPLCYRYSLLHEGALVILLKSQLLLDALQLLSQKLTALLLDDLSLNLSHEVVKSCLASHIQVEPDGLISRHKGLGD